MSCWPFFLGLMFGLEHFLFSLNLELNNMVLYGCISQAAREHCSLRVANFTHANMCIFASPWLEGKTKNTRANGLIMCHLNKCSSVQGLPFLKRTRILYGRLTLHMQMCFFAGPWLQAKRKTLMQTGYVSPKQTFSIIVYKASHFLNAQGCHWQIN